MMFNWLYNVWPMYGDDVYLYISWINQIKNKNLARVLFESVSIGRLSSAL